MKRLLIIVLPFLMFIIQGCDRKKEDHAKQEAVHQKYTCPMHPQVIREAPGECPICGMDLVRVGPPAAKQELSLTKDQVLLANIRTIQAGEGAFNTSKVLNGKIVNNPELTEVVSSRYAGRIERLFVKETGQPVTTGQPLFQIYSEQLQTLQQDYLLQVKQAEAFPAEKIYKDLRDAAANKLRLYGITGQQLSGLAKKNKISPLVTVYAPASGTVNELNVSEGQYVAEGSPVMKLENYNSLWVEAEIYPSEAASVKRGDRIKVRVNGLQGEEQEAVINFIGPQLSPSTQTLTIRAPLSNPGSLFQPGMQAEVFLSVSRKQTAIKLPLTAVIRDSHGAHVWIAKGDNKFALRQVDTGAEDDQSILVSSGISSGERVVVTGAYLLYSELTLKKE